MNKKRIYLILSVICAGLAIAAAVVPVYRRRTAEEQEKVYERLQQQTEMVQDSASGESMPEKEAVPEASEELKAGKEEQETAEKADMSLYDIPEKKVDFAALREENPDIYAWITIPDTNIDYPVLQHPTELDYYLDYNIDGSKGYPGCIYSQFLNSKDFDDFNTVLYGHNMKNGTMFANLHYYEDSDFFEKHPYVYVYTESGALVYQVFGAYAFSDIHLLMGFDLTKESVRRIYIDNIFTLNGLNDNFNTEVEVTTDSRLLTLCTCIGNQPQKRYLVSAVLVADGREE